ncbi:DNA-binding protein HU [Rosistilla carotiformis]|uniref:DNA-binding protein HU n=1 Tax=Rosistilla carotiformis TaxID=2528017 RepID=A0A518JP62_9BACT|nr:DNA-binding protein HU [Rosistilla carotiformis]
MQRTYNAESSVLGIEFVTKKDIVKTISEEVGLTQQQTKKIVQKTFDAIIESLVKEERIELRNFGVFEVKLRAARKARNPRTGKQVSVPAKYVVTFKPGKEMESRVAELTAGIVNNLETESVLDPLERTDNNHNKPADSTTHDAFGDRSVG